MIPRKGMKGRLCFASINEPAEVVAVLQNGSPKEPVIVSFVYRGRKTQMRLSFEMFSNCWHP